MDLGLQDPHASDRRSLRWHRRSVATRNLALVSLVPLLSRCVLATDTGGQFIVRVDSIGLPATASGNTAFDVRLYGAVGPNLCFRVQSVRAQQDSTHLDITVFGAKRDSGGDCLQMPASLDGLPVTVAPPIRDPFTVRVHQPDGSVLSQSLRVQE